MFVGIGVWAYGNGYSVRFRGIEFNAIAIGLLAGLCLVGVAVFEEPISDQQTRREISVGKALFNETLAPAKRLALLSAPLSAPATVSVVDMTGHHLGYLLVAINGEVVGKITERKVVTTTTQLTQNSISAFKTGTGALVSAPFTAQPGGMVTLLVNAGSGGTLMVDQR
jgi:hypothetical protein